MRTILCASDLSEGSDGAVVQAAGYCDQTGTRLVVVHVQGAVYAVPVNGYVAPLLSPEELESLKEHARQALREQIARTGVRCSNLELEAVSSERPVYAEIVDRAESVRADLVVVGNQGASGLARVVLGSVADKVVRHAHCPVLVARPSPRSGTILAATDFSPPSRAALIAADREAARRSGSTRLTVVHSLDLPPDLMGFGFAPLVPAPIGLADSRPALREGAEKRLAGELRETGVQATAVVEDGPAASGIVRLAESLPAELVVLGTAGKTGLRRVLLGSVAEAVVRRAPCSVLVVRGAER
jgi:nucleotide-binding universal stress UspA family protein